MGEVYHFSGKPAHLFVQRAILQRAPLFILRAGRNGTGKSQLAKVRHFWNELGLNAEIAGIGNE